MAALNSSTVNSSAASEPNPFFTQIERAPYEFGYLLRALPRYSHQIKRKDKEQMQQVEAARDHAVNASLTLLHGLEALGSILFAACSNKQHEVDGGVICDIGGLIQHIACELQLLSETERDLGRVLRGDE